MTEIKHGEFLMVDVSTIWKMYSGEAAADNYSEFYRMDCDTLIWDICIMGGQPAYLSPVSTSDDKVDRYVNRFNQLISSTIGWKRYTFCTILEVRGTILILADLSLYPTNYFL